MTVLIVEDNSDFRDFLRGVFSAHGVGVLSADNGVQALALLDSTPKIDLVLTDVNMPLMSGLELLLELQARKRTNLPVVVMSGGTPFSARAFELAGAVAFIEKSKLNVQSILAYIKEGL